ncbi:MAG: hypothetical protein RIQ47_394 [Bacteroidota bacterium]|jgi:outer membrane protein TolC
MKQLLLLISLFCVFSARTKADSLTVLTLENVYDLVLTNHPIAQQAQLLPDYAKAEIRTARGAFDPLLKSDLNNKEFNKEEYWNVWQNSLNVPTWYGVDFKVAYDQTSGKYLDPEATTPDGGLSYVGFTVPIGQGLLIDNRRATLRQAQLLTTQATADKVRAINKLLLQVNKDYWDWSFTYQRMQLHQKSLRLASERFEAIRNRVILGEQAAIDSLEAFIEVQNRENTLNQSNLELTNARVVFANHLWDADGQPVEPNGTVVPQTGNSFNGALSVLPLEQLLDTAKLQHPEIISMQVRIDQLEIERKLAAEKLRPKLNLEYNFLAPGTELFYTSDAYSPLFNDNYKFGVNFSMPLFLRAERGKLGATKIKLEQTRFQQQQLSRDILNQVRTAYNEMTTLSQQIVVQESLLLNADKLLEGELSKFSEGESFLFLVNNRENGVINSQIKLAELRTKYAKSIAFINWTAGNLISRQP